VRTRTNVVVLGILGERPFAGIDWQVLHYLEGFRRLGCSVSYVEGTGEWGYDPDRETVTADPSYAVRHIRQTMEWLGLPEAWAYLAGGSGQLFGMTEDRLRRTLEGADVLVNLCGATLLRDAYLRVPIRIYLETDPVRPQIEVVRGVPFTIRLLSAHTHHFTYGENLGAADCPVPVERFCYHTTRPPVALEWWSTFGPPPQIGSYLAQFTTIANWKQTGKDIEWNGEIYTWSKDVEFRKFLDLPHRACAQFELALSSIDPDSRAELERQGWHVLEAMRVSRDMETYREYISDSLGEFTVAKDQNVRLRSGWFSDRSVCYLAAGRPVIMQETGFSKFLPTGRGLFGFSSFDEIVDATDRISSDYGRHSAAAREIAAEYLSAERLVADMLDRTAIGS